MFRRVGAVFAGVVACQLCMLVSLVAAAVLVVTWPGRLDDALAIILCLLVAPGLLGGWLAGLLTDRQGMIYGLMSTLIFGVTILLVKIWFAPGLGYTLAPSDLILYPTLVIGLALTGAAGGALGGRRRRTGPTAASRRTVISRRQWFVEP